MLTQVFFIIDDVKLAESSNNSFEWKNVRWYFGGQDILPLLHIFQGVKSSLTPRIYALSTIDAVVKCRIYSPSFSGAAFFFLAFFCNRHILLINHLHEGVLQGWYITVVDISYRYRIEVKIPTSTQHYQRGYAIESIVRPSPRASRTTQKAVDRFRWSFPGWARWDKEIWLIFRNYPDLDSDPGCGLIQIRDGGVGLPLMEVGSALYRVPF